MASLNDSSTDKNCAIKDGAPSDIQTDHGNCTTQEAMTNIFSSCNTKNTGYALVSKLIEFIAPFLQENRLELTELKNILDPSDTNPSIDEKTFYDAMTEWTSKIKETPSEAGDDSFYSLVLSEFGIMDKKPSAFGQSTPRNSLGHGCPIKRSSSEMNISNVTGYSIEELNKTDTSHNLEEEKINELEYQNRKLSEELDHFKSVLLTSEDQNEQLRSDLNNLTRKLVSKQKVIEQLQHQRISTEDLAESSSIAQKEVCRLEKVLASTKKEMQHMKENLLKLEDEKQQLENTMERLSNQKIEANNSIFELQSEISLRDQNISSLQDLNKELTMKLSEHEETIKHYFGINERVTTEKQNLEKIIKKRLSQDSFPSIPKLPQSAPITSSKRDSGIFKFPSTPPSSIPRRDHDRLSSPLNPSIARITREFKSFNSPKLLAMLQNPISPTRRSLESNTSSSGVTDSSLDTSRLEKEKIPLNETPPVVVCKKNLEAPVASLPNTKPRSDAVFSQYRFLGCDNNLLYETAEKLYGPLSPCNKRTEPNNNLDFVIKKGDDGNQESILNVSAQSCCSKTCDASNSDISVASASFDKSVGDDMYCELKLLNFSTHESLESEISQALPSDENQHTILTEKIKDLEQEIQQLKTVASEEYKTTILTEKIKDLEEEIQQLKTASEEYKTTIGSLTKERNDLVDRNASVLQELQADAKLHEQKVDQLEEIHSMLAKHDEEKKKQIIALEEVIDHQNIQISAMENEKKLIKSTLQEYKTTIESLTKERNDLVDRNASVLQELQTDAKLHEQKVNQLEEIHSMLAKHDEEKKKQIIALEEVIDHLNIQISAMENEKKLIKSSLQEYKTTIESLTKERNDLVDRNASVLQELQADAKLHEQKVNQLEEIHSMLAKHDEEKKNQIIALEEVIDHQNIQISALENEKKVIKSRLQEHKITIESLTKERNDLADRNASVLQELQADAKSHEQKVEQLEEVHSKLAKHDEDKKNQIIALEEVIEHQNIQISALENEKKLIKSRLHTQRLLMDKLENQVDVKSTENNQMDGEVGILNQQMESLRQNIERSKQEQQSILSKYVASTKTIEELQAELSTAQNEIAKLEEAHKKRVADLETYNDKVLHEKEQALQEANMLKHNHKLLVEENEILLEELELNSYKPPTSEAATQINCANCLELNETIAKLNNKIANAEEKTVKVGNFDKLQRQIENLKASYDSLETELTTERNKNRTLEEASRENVKNTEELISLKDDLELKLRHAEFGLQKMERKNFAIRKKLTDLQSKEDLKTVDRADREVQAEFDRPEVDDYKNNILQLNLKLVDYESRLDFLSRYMTEVGENLNSKRDELECCRLAAMNKWKPFLERAVADLSLLTQLEHLDEIIVEKLTRPLEEEIFKFNQQITLTISFYNALDAVDISVLNKQREVQLNSSSPLRLHNWFAMKYLEPPVSPDSPSIEMPLETLDDTVIDKNIEENFDDDIAYVSFENTQTDRLQSTDTAVASSSLPDNLLEELGLLKDRSGRTSPKRPYNATQHPPNVIKRRDRNTSKTNQRNSNHDDDDDSINISDLSEQNLHQTSVGMQHESPFRFSAIRTASRTLFWCTFFTSLMCLGFLILFLAASQHSWRLIPLNEFIKKNLKVTYPNGPPPV